MVALLLRAFVPVGMMAAPLVDGWLLQICPSGMSMPSYMALLGQSHHSDHSKHSKHSEHAQHEGADADPACALNPGFVAFSESAEPQLVAWFALRVTLIRQPKVRLPRAPPRANRSRAPPVYS